MRASSSWTRSRNRGASSPWVAIHSRSRPPDQCFPVAVVTRAHGAAASTSPRQRSSASSERSLNRFSSSPRFRTKTSPSRSREITCSSPRQGSVYLRPEPFERGRRLARPLGHPPVPTVVEDDDLRTDRFGGASPERDVLIGVAVSPEEQPRRILDFRLKLPVAGPRRRAVPAEQAVEHRVVDCLSDVLEARLRHVPVPKNLQSLLQGERLPRIADRLADARCLPDPRSFVNRELTVGDRPDREGADQLGSLAEDATEHHPAHAVRDHVHGLAEAAQLADQPVLVVPSGRVEPLGARAAEPRDVEGDRVSAIELRDQAAPAAPVLRVAVDEYDSHSASLVIGSRASRRSGRRPLRRGPPAGNARHPRSARADRTRAPRLGLPRRSTASPGRSPPTAAALAGHPPAAHRAPRVP